MDHEAGRDSEPTPAPARVFSAQYSGVDLEPILALLGLVVLPRASVIGVIRALEGGRARAALLLTACRSGVARGNGMTFAVIAARLLAAEILGGFDEDCELFAFDR